MDDCIDLIQARYGWTDADISALSYSRFARVVKVAAERFKSEARDQFKQGAWIAFQLGAGGEMNFGAYLDKMGLSDTPHVEPRVTAQEALAKAEKILEMARERI
jgi:hypothetical protein